jgi:hypothetical protein
MTTPQVILNVRYDNDLTVHHVLYRPDSQGEDLNRKVNTLFESKYPDGPRPARNCRNTKKNKHKNFVQEEEKVREFGVTSHMPALEREVEHACGEEDPASDKQTSKYE